MATPLKSTNTIDFNSAKLDAAKAASEEKQDKYYDLRFRLSTVLQSTLDVKELLQIFFAEITTSVKLDGLTYSNDAQKLNIKIGKRSTHSCGYRLITPKDHLGEISFYHSKRFSENHLETIEVLLSTLVCPLRNAVHYGDAVRTALTDPLTGSGNRIALNESLNREIKLSKRHDHPLSILLVDIDKFKKINDQYGHSAGDDILKVVVTCISEATRQTDICFRFGGEEFVVILNKTDLAGSMTIAERIRSSVEDLQIDVNKEIVKISISIGATRLCAKDNFDSLFNRADKALYSAKQKGRNQVRGL